MLWPMYCGSSLFGTSGGIEQEDVSMNEYLKQYIELQKQFRETKGKADSVRALYAFKEELEQSEDTQASCVPPIHLLYGCNTHKSNKKLGGEKFSHRPAFC